MKQRAAWAVGWVAGLAVACAVVAAEPEKLAPRIGADYAKVRMDLIRAEQGAEDGERNEWEVFVSTLDACRGYLETSIETSEPYAAYAKSMPESDYPAPGDAYLACLGQIDAAELATEAERVLKRFDQSTLARSLETFYDPEQTQLYFAPNIEGQYPGVSFVRGGGPLRALGRALEARVVLAARDRDLAGFRAAIRRTMIACRTTALSADMVTQMTANVVRANLVRRLVATDLPAGFSAAAIEEISRVPMPRWELAVECDMIDAWETIDILHRESIGGLHHGPSAIMNALMHLVIATRMDECGRIEAIYGGLLATFETDPTVRNKALASADLAWKLIDISRLGWRYPLSRLLAPSVFLFRQAEQAYRMDVEGGVAALAVTAFREQTGRLPDTLDELAPKHVAAAPKDWFGEQPGLTALRYRRVDQAADPAGRSFIIYSLGADGVDHEGKEPKERPADAVMRRGAGTDYVVSRRAVKY